ncbi:MAG: hypothetical protein IPJ18_18365 [Betaproteobacteria bacterium]|nr:hypothetical protein [Betaproteobacteria bacterium]
MTSTVAPIAFGMLALDYCNKKLPLQVLQSAAGFYIGTQDPESGPCSRESNEYFRTREKAQTAFENNQWTERVPVT